MSAINVFFRGDAPATLKVYTLTVSGTLTASASYTVSLKDEAGNVVRSVVYTSDGTPSLDEISAGIKAAISAATYSEFLEFSAVDTSGGTGSVVVTQNANLAKGLTLTLALSTSGSATLASTVTTASSSPEDWSLTANWDAGNLPSTGSPPNNIYVSNLTNNISCGLAAFNASGAVLLQFLNCLDIGGTEFRNSYREYRAKYLKCPFTTCIVDSPNTKMLRLDGGTQNSLGTLVVNNISPNLINNLLESLQFINSGSAGCAVTLNRGSMGIAIYPGETAVIPTITQNYTANANDTILRCGNGVTLTNVYRTGGAFTFASALTLLEQRNKAGVATYEGGAATLAAVKLYAGSLVLMPTSTGLVITNITIGAGCVLDLSKCSYQVRVTNPPVCYPGYKIHDPYSRLATNPGVTDTISCDFRGCSFEGLTRKSDQTVAGL